MNKDHAVGFGVGILSGVLIGGIIALLYAPKTGKETRQLIKDKAVEMVDVFKDKSNGAIHALKS